MEELKRLSIMYLVVALSAAAAVILVNMAVNS